MTRRKKWILGLGLVSICLGIVSAPLLTSVLAERRERAAGPGRFQFDPNDFRPRRVLDGFAPIVNPRHVPADEADDRVQPHDLVLGIELDGVARAYPINMLTGPSREIFNDQLGEHAIAATW